VGAGPVRRRQRPRARPQRDRPDPVSHENTETTPGDGVVPTVFNGNFENGTRQQLFLNENRGRFPFSYELPGWSFHGGTGFSLAGEAIDVGGLFVVETDYSSYVKKLLDMAIERAGEHMFELAKKHVLRVEDSPTPRPEPTDQEKFEDLIFETIDAKLKEKIPFYTTPTSRTCSRRRRQDGRVGPGALRRALGRGRLGPRPAVRRPRVPRGLIATYAPDAMTDRIVDAAGNFDTITHNWAYVPADARAVSFELTAPFSLLQESKVSVYLDVPSLQSVPGFQRDPVLGWKIGEVEIAPSFFSPTTTASRCRPPSRGRSGG
jgi:hypothetical protein